MAEKTQTTRKTEKKPATRTVRRYTYTQVKTREKKKQPEKPAGTGRLLLRVLLCLIPGAVAVALYLVGGANADFAEWFAVNIYPLWVGSLGRICGVFPVSVSEILLYAGVLTLLILVIRDVVRLLRRKLPQGWLLRWVGSFLLIAGIFCLMFMVGGGVNYNRKTFSTLTKMDTSGGTADELYEVALFLAGKVNETAPLVQRDTDGCMVIGEDFRESAVASMNQLARTYDCLIGFYPQPKGILASRLLSYQNITGIYSPFLAEANYNADVPQYNLPHTVCHELSHLRGFMREDEANFIGFLACVWSEDLSFRYSGYLLGYIYVSNALYGENADRWREVRGLLCAEANTDLAANSAYWKQFEGPVAERATQRNDSYLKFNHQEDGVKSYNRVVNLILDYYRNRL